TCGTTANDDAFTVRVEILSEGGVESAILESDVSVDPQTGVSTGEVARRGGGARRGAERTATAECLGADASHSVSPGGARGGHRRRAWRPRRDPSRAPSGGRHRRDGSLDRRG